MKYYSKKDLWLGLFIWGMVLVSFMLMVYSAITTHSLMLIVLSVLWLGLIAFVYSVWFGTYYVFEKEGLEVHCGPMREFIRYETVTRVCPSKAAWSSAALSMDRIAVFVNNQLKVYISPREREAFLAELRNRCPGILQENDWQ